MNPFEPINAPDILFSIEKETLALGFLSARGVVAAA
jgi:hypothetical protein